VAACAALGLLAAGCSSGSSGNSSTTTQAPTTSTTRPGLSPTAVRALQAALFKVGCYSGKIDGIAGSLTTAAVQAFQGAEGLSVDGVYGASTKAKLVAAAALGTRVCTSTSSTTTTTTSSSTSTTTGNGSAPAGALAAVNAYETTNGPAAGTWKITSAQVSTVDPTYVLFRIGPAPGYENQVQGGYGFVHDQAGTWTVGGFGSADVGCPPGAAEAPVVPTAVLSGFGLSCPPAA